MNDPLAIAFANTRSSVARDRIATVDQFREWARSWSSFAGFLPGIRPSALPEIQVHRDATQHVLHRLADGKSPSEEELDRATRCGLAEAAFRLRPARGRIAIDGDAPGGVAHLLGRAVVDFLLSPQAAEVRRCQGVDCRKVFISHRADRRWCDSRICGNRARVAAHARRRS
ncbi:CGNR zinc finger domain-containing protein [Saccharopolyspora sp. NPDC050389]|uniref:CGNR zinc finger domain-containing protein n=1 Tax=Saccharopolyspora sp. NPDC050389 TaxID=3155516 RepID=UPI0033C3415C